MLDDAIYMLAYFHKNSVTSCKEIKKDCDKKDCDIEKNWLWLKKIVIKKIHACNTTNLVVI